MRVIVADRRHRWPCEEIIKRPRSILFIRHLRSIALQLILITDASFSGISERNIALLIFLRDPRILFVDAAFLGVGMLFVGLI